MKFPVTFLLSVTASTLVSAATAATKTCGKLKGCFMRDLNTGVETKLDMTSPFIYEYTAGKSRYSIRCDVMDGTVDQMEYTFLPEGTIHRTWRAPYWIDGSSGDEWVEPSDWLNSCGAKNLKVEGILWNKDCFVATFPIVAQCTNDCVFDLMSAGEGSASVVISKDQTVAIEFKGAKPDTVYTIWTDFMSRSSGKLASDYPVATNPIDINKSGPGLGRGIAPTFAKTDPVYEGMRLDVNSVLTDAKGNGKFVVKLDYNLLKAGNSPVIGETLTMQGKNVVGGGWLRLYEQDISSGPSLQQLDANHVPKVVTATAQGFTIVGHFKKFTHGHMPGVGGVDHFMGFMGDFPTHCMMK